MRTQHLIWGLAAATLLTPATVGVVGVPGARHASLAIVSGPLPEAVRHATERFET